MDRVVKDKEEQQENRSDTKTCILLYDLIYRNFFMLICIYEKRMYILYKLVYSYLYRPRGGAKSHRKSCFLCNLKNSDSNLMINLWHNSIELKCSKACIFDA